MVRIKERSCEQSRNDLEPSKRTGPCKPGANDLLFCKGKDAKCQFSSGFPTSEYCPITPRIAVGKYCVLAA